MRGGGGGEGGRGGEERGDGSIYIGKRENKEVGRKRNKGREMRKEKMWAVALLSLLSCFCFSNCML